MYMHNGVRIYPDTPFSIDGTSYPSNWLDLTSDEEKRAIGIEWVEDSVWFDSTYYVDVGIPKPLDDSSEIDTDGQPILRKGIKSTMIENVKLSANARLALTDWLVIRKFERSIEIPSNVVAHRAAILAEHDRLVDGIKASADVEQLKSVMSTQNWPA